MKKLALMSILMLSSCATIFSGITQKIVFDSNVKNLKIYANNTLVCAEVPCIAEFDRKPEVLYIMAVAKGYEISAGQISTTFNKVSLANTTSTPGWLIDIGTNAVIKYRKNKVYINMRPITMNKRQYTKETNIKAFVLLNYMELKIGNAEYVETLSQLTNREITDLKRIITASNTEKELLDNLI